MFKRYFALSVLMALIIAPYGYAEMEEKSRVELDYGTSYRLYKFNQILNPRAEENLEPVRGIEGQAAQEAYDKYIKSFERVGKEPTYILNIGKEK